MESYYESGKVLAEYLLFHFGSPEEILPQGGEGPAGMIQGLDFPVRTAARFSGGEAARGLDLGCAVGRSSFEMARGCREVVGIDYSGAFVRAAEQLRVQGSLRYDRLEEAAVRTPLVARLPAGVDPQRVRFVQGDATALPADLGDFDRVHAANLLCRLADPALLLGKLPELVRSGGELVLATPCTWLAEYTPPANWPAAGTLPWLRDSLASAFTLVSQSDEPFLLRETARKYQWTSAMVTLWRRDR